MAFTVHAKTNGTEFDQVSPHCDDNSSVSRVDSPVIRGKCTTFCQPYMANYRTAHNAARHTEANDATRPLSLIHVLSSQIVMLHKIGG